MSTTARRPALSRERIVRAAIELADSDGLGAVSMRAVARALGVEAMSLYHHVANKEDLLDGMVDAVFAEFYAPRPGGDWRAELRAHSQSARAVLQRHRWAVGLMDTRRNPGLENLRHHDAVLGCLRQAGFSLALTGHAYALLDAHLYGFLIQELGVAFEGEQDLAELGTAIRAAIPEGQLPHFREFTLEHALQPGYDFGDEFDVGLDLILEGLAARLAAEQS